MHTNLLIQDTCSDHIVTYTIKTNNRSSRKITNQLHWAELPMQDIENIRPRKPMLSQYRAIGLHRANRDQTLHTLYLIQKRERGRTPDTLEKRQHAHLF
jgi:hypothetical protein